jgi:hypothetical protein
LSRPMEACSRTRVAPEREGEAPTLTCGTTDRGAAAARRAAERAASMRVPAALREQAARRAMWPDEMDPAARPVQPAVTRAEPAERQESMGAAEP